MNIMELSELCIDGMRECLNAGSNFTDFEVFIYSDGYVNSVRKVELRRDSKTGDFVLVFYD